MADAETEAEWARLREVDKARKKAAESLEHNKDKTSLAYLDPTKTKVKGFSNDRETTILSVEKFANAGVLFATAGVALGLIGDTGGFVANTNHLGLAGAVIAAPPQGLGLLCLGIAMVSAVTGVISSLWVKKKYHTKMSYTFYLSIVTLGVLGLYFFFR